MRRDPKTDAPDLFGFARDYLHAYMPKVRGLSPKTIEAYRISLECFLDYLAETGHVEREQVSFDHFDRNHLKSWLAWMTDQQQLRPENSHAAAQRHQSVPGVRVPRRHHPRRAQPGGEDSQSAPQSQNTDHLPQRTRNTGHSRRVQRADSEIPQEPDAAHPAL